MKPEYDRQARLLVIDDQPTNLKMVGDILSRLNFDLILSSDSEEAITLLGQHKVDLILLDVIMPGRDGFEICQMIQANPTWVDIPIIFLSAASEKSLIVRALEVGGVDYVTKPFNPAELLSRVRTHLALKSAPEMEPGILYTERQFGLLELHSDRMEDLDAAGEAILKGIGARPEDQLKPQILYHDIIEDLSDQHAIILNRSRDASILVPGVALLIYEMAPALFACVAANEAEKAAPNAVINDVQMMGATGRLFMSGSLQDMRIARDTITAKLEAIKGR